MLDENTGIISAATNPIISKALESFGNDRWTTRDMNAINEFAEPEPMTSTYKKEALAKKREGEKVSKIQVRKGGSDSMRESKPKKDMSKEELDGEKLKNSRKFMDESKGNKSKKRGKEMERVEEKIVPEQKLKPTKSKALSAFGMTFYKSENDPSAVARPSSTLERFGRSRRSQSREGGYEEEDGRNMSETKLITPRKNQSKLTGDGEEARGKGKSKGGKTRSMQRIGSDSSLQDGKTVGGKKSSKVKVITAFGSTFRKNENDAVPLPKKKAPSFTDRLMRSKSTKLKEVELEVVEDSPSKHGLNQSGAKISSSKNKLMDMVEESSKEKGQSRGAYSTSAGKKARSPYQTSSEVKANPSKIRVEGDTNGVKQQPEEKAEIGREMSFFEKIQQNVRAYFSPRSPEMAKFEEEEERVQEGEKRRTASFHRSKTLQKNALAEASPKCRKSIGLPMEPDQQIENVSSAYGVASAFTQVQEFHQEIKRRNWIQATSEVVQEEYLTPIVNCLPGDFATDRTRQERSRIGVCQTSSRPMCKSRSKRPFPILSRKSSAELPSSSRKIQGSRSEEMVAEKNVQFRSVVDQLHHGDVPRRERSTRIASNTFKPKQNHFLPRRRDWIVYTLTETSLRESKFIETPPRRDSTTTAETTTPESELSACTAEEGVGVSDSAEAELTNQKSEQAPPSFTLKDIISLTRKVFEENEGRKNDSTMKNVREPDGHNVAKCKDSSLGYYLEKLMEEKRNYLNLQKTKNFRKAQKVNFIADSFNFFNLLNKEFLSVKTCNPSVEELRNIIAENRSSNIEEYLDMYKEVIRTSLTKPDQCLIDKAKVDLERYTDMYYDLMKYICMEKEGKSDERSKTVSSDPLRSSKSGKVSKINYYEIFKQDMRKNVNLESGYNDRIKPKPERSVCMTKIEENRRNREFNAAKNTYKTHNPRRAKTGIDSAEEKTKSVSRTEKAKQIVELLSPPKNKESTLKLDKTEAKDVRKEQNNQEKVLLQISVCNEGLIIKQVTPSIEGDMNTSELTGVLASDEDENKTKSDKPLSEDGKRSSSRTSVSEAYLVTSAGMSSDVVEKTQSKLLLKTESDVTIYPKSSIEEENDSSESPVEHPMFKFRAFRKLLNEGIKYLTSFGESPETDGHECPKIPKGGRVPETCEEPIKYPKATIYVRQPNENEPKKFLDQWEPGHQKSTYVRDPRQTLLRDRGSPVRTRVNEMQEEKARRLLKRNLSSFSRGVSPNKISKREPGGEGRRGTSLWWRSERSAVGNTSPVRQRKPYRPIVRKVECNPLANRLSLLSNTKETKLSSPGSTSKERRKSQGRKEKESANKEEDDDEDGLKESLSHYETPTGSYFEWQLGMKNLKDLLSETSKCTLNLGGAIGGKLISEEVEEKELRKMDFSCGDERNQESTHENESNTPEMSLRLRCNNPLRTDWDQLLEASFQKDYQRVSEVLNQFMGNISEAWKAAVHLKDLIKPKSVKEPTKEGADQPGRDEIMEGENDQQQQGKKKAIESFRNFLRILTNVFECNPEEISVRRELFLLMREVLESSTTPSSKSVLNELPNTGNKTVFRKEIAQIPQELRDMVAESLLSQGKNFNRTKEDYEPGSFVTAIKEVGEKLKSMYFAEESETQKVVKEPEKEVANEVDEQPKKIYYLPSKKNFLEDTGSESTRIRSNLQTLAEKINRIYREREFHGEVEGEKEEKSMMKKLVNSHSSIYFDANDKFQQSEDGQRVGFYGLSDVKPNRMPLAAVDESYFALTGKTFEKYRDLIYDKIITFVKSDDPRNFSYGMTLLSKMMEKDDRPISGGERTVRENGEKKWHNLVDKLMEMCQIIESEVKEQEKLLPTGHEAAGKKEVELARTCEYLKNHITKMRALMEEMKAGHQGRKSNARVRALEESRETNMERQLMGRSNLIGKSYLSQNYLDNVIAFINSIGTIGCSIDKFSKNFLPYWLGGSNKKQPELKRSESATEEFKDSYDSILDCNKVFVMSLKKNIDRRQKKIRELVDLAEKDGIKREESLSEERVARKVRDLKKCYNLLEKMICDPTMLPPKWLNANDESQEVEEEISEVTTPANHFPVMTLLEDIISRAEASRETSLVRYSSMKEQKKAVYQQLPIGLLAFINFPGENLKYDLPVKGQGQDDDDVVFLRPKTA